MFNLNSEPSEYTVKDFAVPDLTPEQEQQKTQLLIEIQREFERLGIDREFQEMLSYRLLAQSPLAAELLSYLEATDAPEQLRDRLESLIVQRASDEVKIAEGVVQVGDSLIILLQSD